MQTHAGPVLADPISVSSLSFTHVDSGGLVPWCPPSPLALTFLPLPLSHPPSLSLERKSLIETSHLGWSIPKPLCVLVLIRANFRSYFADFK